MRSNNIFIFGSSKCGTAACGTALEPIYNMPPITLPALPSIGVQGCGCGQQQICNNSCGCNNSCSNSCGCGSCACEAVQDDCCCNECSCACEIECCCECDNSCGCDDCCNSCACECTCECEAVTSCGCNSCYNSCGCGIPGSGPGVVEPVKNTQCGEACRQPVYTSPMPIPNFNCAILNEANRDDCITELPSYIAPRATMPSWASAALCARPERCDNRCY